MSRDQILDQEIDAQMVNEPFLAPTPYTQPQAPTTATATTAASSNAAEDLIDYLNNVKEIPKSDSPRLKKLKEKIDNIYKHVKEFEVKECKSALKEFAKVYYINGVWSYGTRTFLQYSRPNMVRVIRDNRKTKVKLILKCFMEVIINDDDLEIVAADFHSDIEVNLDGTDEDDLYITMEETILEKIATYLSKKSQNRLHSIRNLELHIVTYDPLKAGTWFPLPEELANKKAIVNVKSEDNKCFLWCVLRVLYPKK